MTALIEYQGELRCKATHLQSGTTIETDAPTDNRGRGEKFSPTDTVCVALATCAVTTMAIKAQGMNIELKDTKIEVTKHMLSSPRRIGKIDVILTLPHLHLSDNDKLILERTGNNCPVVKSLNPAIELNMQYNW